MSTNNKNSSNLAFFAELEDLRAFPCFAYGYFTLTLDEGSSDLRHTLKDDYTLADIST